MKSRQLKTQTQESQTQREYNAISCHQVHSISTLLLSDIARVLSSEHIVSSLYAIGNYRTFLYKYKYNYQYNAYICTNTLYYYVCLPGGTYCIKRCILAHFVECENCLDGIVWCGVWY